MRPYFASRRSRNAAYVALLAIQIVDIRLDAKEIADNYARVTGRHRARQTTPAGTLRLMSIPPSGSVGIQYRFQF